jgi:hypothetical protein
MRRSEEDACRDMIAVNVDNPLFRPGCDMPRLDRAQRPVTMTAQIMKMVDCIHNTIVNAAQPPSGVICKPSQCNIS